MVASAFGLVTSYRTAIEDAYGGFSGIGFAGGTEVPGGDVAYSESDFITDGHHYYDHTIPDPANPGHTILAHPYALAPVTGDEDLGPTSINHLLVTNRGDWPSTPDSFPMPLSFGMSPSGVVEGLPFMGVTFEGITPRFGSFFNNETHYYLDDTFGTIEIDNTVAMEGGIQTSDLSGFEFYPSFGDRNQFLASGHAGQQWRGVAYFYAAVQPATRPAYVWPLGYWVSEWFDIVTYLDPTYGELIANSSLICTPGYQLAASEIAADASRVGVPVVGFPGPQFTGYELIAGTAHPGTFYGIYPDPGPAPFTPLPPPPAPTGMPPLSIPAPNLSPNTLLGQPGVNGSGFSGRRSREHKAGRR